jgi:hypothetical protein
VSDTAARMAEVAARAKRLAAGLAAGLAAPELLGRAVAVAIDGARARVRALSEHKLRALCVCGTGWVARVCELGRRRRWAEQLGQLLGQGLPSSRC